MKILLLLCLTAASAYAGPKPKATPKVPSVKNVYTAVGDKIGRGVASDGTVYYAFTCVNAKGDLIYVGIREEYIKLIVDQSKVAISYK